MKFLTASAAALAAMAACAAPASAQNRAELQLTARTDDGGAAASCLIATTLRNVGDTRISSFGAEIAATHTQTGAALTVPVAMIPFTGVQPGETKEWTALAVSGARCDQVRLRVTRVTCVRRCAAVSWRQDGLAALETPQ